MALEVENPQVGDMLDLFCDEDLISRCLVIEKYRSHEYYGEKPTMKNQGFIFTMHIIYKRKSGSPTCHKVGQNWPISQTVMETMIYKWKKAA